MFHNIENCKSECCSHRAKLIEIPNQNDTQAAKWSAVITKDPLEVVTDDSKMLRGKCGGFVDAEQTSILEQLGKLTMLQFRQVSVFHFYPLFGCFGIGESGGIGEAANIFGCSTIFRRAKAFAIKTDFGDSIWFTHLP
jgi:hypothetical protein